MNATDFIKKCLLENDILSLISCSSDFCSLSENEVVSAFIHAAQTRHKMNIVHWNPNNPAYPEYMLLGGDRGILAYICFSYFESHSEFDVNLLKTWSYPVLQVITKADSHLDRPVFFISFINCPNHREVRFETNEQIKDRWLKTDFSDSTYCPIYEEMGDATDLFSMWNDLKKNSVHFY